MLHRPLADWYWSSHIWLTDHSFRFSEKEEVEKHSELTQNWNIYLASTQECREWRTLAPVWSLPWHIHPTHSPHLSQPWLTLIIACIIKHKNHLLHVLCGPGGQGSTTNPSLYPYCLGHIRGLFWFVLFCGSVFFLGGGVGWGGGV